MTTLRDIWNSSTGLLKRFDLMPSSKKAWLKMHEEIAELHEALFKLAGNRKNIPYKQDTAEELADVIVTALNVGYVAGLSIEDIERAIAEVIRKNDAKTDKTHAASDGWIRKIEVPAYMEEGQ